jgi:hypothetical protein
MGMLTHALKQDAEVVTTTTDEYGDQIVSSEVSVKCRFRYITQVDQADHAELINAGSEAIIWFEPDASIEEGTIVKTNDVYWRVDRLVKARRLSGSQIHFLKAYVNRHEIAEDFS